MDTKGLTNNGAKIRKSGKIFHGGVIGEDFEFLPAEPCLNIQGLGECEQGPRRSRTVVVRDTVHMELRESAYLVVSWHATRNCRTDSTSDPLI
jgi:hypothetical protein